MHVLLARGAPVGAIVRRDNGGSSQLLTWNTETDELTQGQWLGAKLDRKRMHLSPDGRYFIYHAERTGAGRAEGCWTAVSKPPYFSALAIWLHAENGPFGGLFGSSEEILVRSGTDDAPLDLRAQGCPFSFRSLANDAEETSWQLDGWETIQEAEVGDRSLPPITDEERDAMSDAEYSAWARQQEKTLRERMEGRSRIRSKRFGDRALWRIEDVWGHDVRYALRTADGHPIHSIRGARWADWDQRGRLVLERLGLIYQGEWSDGAGWCEDVIVRPPLAEYTNLQAPDWALRW